MLSRSFFFGCLLSLLGSTTVVSQGLIINEILSENINGIVDSYGENSDWIEIYNSGSSAVNLEGYYLSDKLDNPLKWEFPDVNIPAKGYLLVFASEEDNIGNELHANFKLSTDGENILLTDPSGLLVDSMDSIPMRADVSYGRLPDAASIFKYFAVTTPLAANSSTGYDGFVTDPQLSMGSGFYDHAIDVEVDFDDEDALVRYTLDGSEPNIDSPIYDESFHFDDVENHPNVFSMIPTNPGFDTTKTGYDANRANSRGWLPPNGLVNKANVLKVKAFKTGNLSSHTIASTYFIFPNAEDRYSLPVMSITANKEDFFSDETGIYVYGTTGEEGNYNESGRDWERPITMQLFEKDGSLAFEQNFGARIHGGGARHSTLKNLRMYARSDYGKKTLKYRWFENSDNKTFKRFLVRGPGHRPNCVPRDDLADLLLENQNMDLQHTQQVIVFLNGEYWGIHTVKERFDQDYLEIKYGKKDDDYVILRNGGTLDSGEEGDEDIYADLLDFVKNNDISLPENYEYIKSQIDIDNYLTYFTSEVFMGNVDWVNTNIKFWRYKGLDKNDHENSGLDGKWRWFLYDFDLTFGGSCSSISPNPNVLDNAFDPDYGRSTVLAIGLKSNQQFVNDFVNRMCDHINSNFSVNNMLDKIQEIDGIMSPEMLEHVQRWRYPSQSTTLEDRQYEIPSTAQWMETMEALYDYPETRRLKVFNQMIDEFDLQDTVSLQLDVNDMDMGNIQVNSIFISKALDGVSDAVYPWQGTYFEQIPIQLMAVPKLGYRFVRWDETGDTQDTLSISLNTEVNYTAIFEKDPDFSFDDALYINEFMASNKTTIEDEFGAFADWIEIYNPNNKPVDLASFYISDDGEDTFKYQFPRGSKTTIIPALGYMLVWADDHSERGALHTNFKLSSSGEDITLFAPDSSLVDYLSYGEQQEDVSFGREKDGDDAWKFFQDPIGPTPGRTNNNSAIVPLQQKAGLGLYPNPVLQGRMIYFNDMVDIQIYNSIGELLVEKRNITKMSTVALKPGLYFIKTNNNALAKLLVE